MYSLPIVVKTVKGNTDLMGLLNEINKASQPNVSDLLYAGQRQRSRILTRTEQGVDFEGRSFHPYSTTGPYYFYPGKNAKGRKAAKNRFAKTIGVANKGVTKINGGSASRTRLGIKFSSYAAFKSALGRGVVDLFGPWAPHMLQALVVKVSGFVMAGDTAGADPNGAGGSDAPADEITIGIYGAEAARASGHNEGTKHLPQRKFLGVNDQDKQLMLGDVLSRVAARMRRVLGNI